MSPVEFTLEVIGETQVARTLLRFGENAAHSSALWNQMKHDLELIERVQFLTQGAHGSGGWSELKEATVRAKERKHQEPWILRATNALFNSLTESGAAGSIREVTETFLRFGTSISYARPHQSGAPKINLPRRPPVQLTEIERKELTRSVQRFIVTGEVRGIAG